MISIGLLGEMIIFTHAGEIEEYNIRLGGSPEWRKKRKARREFLKVLVPWLENEKVLATVTQSGWDAGLLRMHRGGSSKAGDPV